MRHREAFLLGPDISNLMEAFTFTIVTCTCSRKHIGQAESSTVVMVPWEKIVSYAHLLTMSNLCSGYLQLECNMMDVMPQPLPYIGNAV